MPGKINLRDLEPMRPGLFEFDTEGRPIALVGGRCPSCGQITFPKRAACGKCPLDAGPDRHVLSTKGEIYSATVVHVPSGLGHAAPYAYGYVDLPADDARIFAPLFGLEGQAWRPGQKVKLVFAKIDAKALPDLLGYGFAPEEEVAQ
ncbi:Zn-ribbon domain-containing OB-fold protein [Hoeflea alexandrii]|uniref:Zn-ribbon domain-containing OB-fold protein n=1 Tax=Hoeflea alexandrii TaxID=288436 RepID=UPI0022AF9EB1|nr:OB-fold domain-containing protein [Hoeflea alexandrii]MCZ4291664.1 OB-fold domain-containing protein [Hoeflea alexandrii]